MRLSQDRAYLEFIHTLLYLRQRVLKPVSGVIPRSFPQKNWIDVWGVGPQSAGWWGLDAPKSPKLCKQVCLWVLGLKSLTQG